MYGKIFSSLWHGSLLGQGDAQLVFVLLIAHSDKDGSSEAHPAEISTWTGIGQDRVNAALEILQTDDPDSRTEDEGGKRLVRVGLSLWHIVNYQKYLSMQDRDVVRDQNRERKKQARERDAQRDAQRGRGR